jgi:hypothetical protein
MPDLAAAFERSWKMITGITLVATLIAFLVTSLRPKQYLSTVTALPANSAMADKARIFNNNIEALYSEYGSVDELDKIEGTAALDTIYLAATNAFHLESHYKTSQDEHSVYKAAQQLKKNSKISRSGYGELKINVWDHDRNLAATLANFLFSQLQSIHQRLQNESSAFHLWKLKEAYAQKQVAYRQLADSMIHSSNEVSDLKGASLLAQLQQYGTAIDQFEMSVKASPPPLIAVEMARPAVTADKPRTAQVLVFSFFAAFLFSFLLALLIQNRGQ